MKCLHCSKTSQARGLCGSCYQAAFKLVTGGTTTWKKLENKKLALPSSRALTAFLIAFRGK